MEPYADTAGKTFVLPSEAIAHREPATSSIMPAGLEKNLSIQDLRDLVTFLDGKREKRGLIPVMQKLPHGERKVGGG